MDISQILALVNMFRGSGGQETGVPGVGMSVDQAPSWSYNPQTPHSAPGPQAQNQKTAAWNLPVADQYRQMMMGQQAVSGRAKTTGPGAYKQGGSSMEALMPLIQHLLSFKGGGQ